VPGLADALAAWVRAAGPERATFVANSLGCQVVVDLALRYPELVERAVLIGSTVDPAARSVLAQVGRGLLDLLGERLTLLPVLVWDYLRAGPVRCWQTLRFGVEDPLEDKLRRVPVPVLVLRGSRDPISPQSWGERMARLLPHGRLQVIPGAPHAANHSAPDAVAQAVRSFIAREGGNPAAGQRAWATPR
jgi:pimeloyl-ACP methyl ester carboxylesterase